MEINHWISISSALIVAAGWFVTGALNRSKDVAQKRLDYRLATLEAFLPVWFTIQKCGEPFASDPNFLEKLENTRSKFQLYGLQDEIDTMEQFILAIEKQNLSGANTALEKLVPLVRSRIRKELKLPDLP